MVVFHERVKGDFTSAGADGEDREFASEGDKTFEDQFCVGKLGLGFRNVVRGAKAERFYGGVEFSGVRNGGEFSGGDAEFAEEIFFREAVLRGLEGSGRRIDGNALGKKPDGFHGNVFKFVGDELEAAREFFKRGLIGVVGGHALRDAAYGSFRRRIEKAEMEAERIAGEGEHVAELSAAEDTDGHARFPFFFGAGAADGGKLYAENSGGKERGIHRAGHANGERADRDATRHLRDGQERIEALKG